MIFQKQRADVDVVATTRPMKWRFFSLINSFFVKRIRICIENRCGCEYMREKEEQEQENKRERERGRERKKEIHEF
jgi:hypothetical protein